MANATKLLAVTTVLGVASSGYLYLDRRSLASKLAARTGAIEAADRAAPKPVEDGDAWTAGAPRTATLPPATLAPEPSLPELPKEHRLDRRARRTEEFAAMFGRQDGETEQEYRDRIGPLIAAGLAVPRLRAADSRRVAEERAGVSPEQSAKLDQAFEKVYGDALDYANKSIQDGTLSPYERNVAGWLDFAGGLGGILNDTQGQVVGKILSPDQIKAMSASGFEWGEYLGLQTPWENIQAPPPRK